MVSFPGATSKEILHYLDVHLTNSSPDAVILHVGVNDLLEDNSKSKIENLEKTAAHKSENLLCKISQNCNKNTS